MEFIDALSGGFSSLSTFPIALALIVGAALGIVVGVLPGVGPGVTIAVLLPFTYGMPPLGGISLLLGVYLRGFLWRCSDFHFDSHTWGSLLHHDHV